jgi:hypothetical protein
MKQLPLITVLAAFTMIISACGAPAAPTVNPVEVQNTAVAAALTMVAETQAAVPTMTPLPPTALPTETSLPTLTPLPLPTLGATLPATVAPATAGSGVDPCANRQLSPKKGRETTIRVVNGTRVTITVSMYLNETEGAGECGWRSFNLSRNNDIVFTDLVQGCYNLWAWSDDPKGRFRSSGGGCINNPDKWTFEVTDAVIKFNGP